MTPKRADATAKLTAKGLATRARILDHAAELVYSQGVHATNNEQLRGAAGVSGSQLNHYFPDKESLVVAVIARQADQVLAVHDTERFGRLETIEALREWAEFYVANERACHDGCRLGSLAGEVIKTGPDIHDAFDAEFERWKDIIRGGLEHMRDNGVLRADTNPSQLTNLLLGALQGGILLAQIAQDTTPLRDALTAAVDHVQSFETAS
jgi:TetR/AcrR family transcriptional repressor of nem operon